MIKVKGLPRSPGWLLPAAVVAALAAGGIWAARVIAAGADALPAGSLLGEWLRVADLAVAALLLLLGFVLALVIRRIRGAEAALCQYCEVLEVTADGVLGIDNEGRIAFVGRKMTALLGYEAGELLGCPVRAILPHELPLAGGQEVVARRRDGSELTLESRAGPPLVAGGPLSATLVLRDVTRSRQTRELLGAHEAHLRMMVEQMPAILWTTDRGLRITSTLGAGLAALEVRPEELIGVSMLECLGQDDPEATPIAAHLRAVGGESLSYEMEWKGRTWKVRVDPLRGAGTAVVGTVGVLLDVTQSKQTLAELKARERQQAAVAALGLRALTDPNLDALGREAADAVRQTLEVDTCEVLPAGSEPPRNGDGLSVEIPGKRGPLGILTARRSRRRDFGQDDLHFLQAVANVLAASTERRQAEEEQGRLEEQLRQAQKMEAVGRLAGGVAHDFNNLLTVITGYSEMLCQALPEGQTLRDQAEQILRAGERAAGLTRQLLAFGRKQMLAPRVLNLNALVTESGKMLRRLIGEDIVLSTELDPTLYPVWGDAGQIEQVLMNLAVNARDAMPTGGQLTLRTSNVTLNGAALGERPEVAPGPYALLTVSDTGCGMAAHVKARIFEPFFTTKEMGKGTGLGLATVYGIVKQSGGHIEIDSEPGQGSSFRIYLPPQRDVRANPAPDPRRGDDAPGGTETVLLVEDEEAVRALARQSLRLKGYAVLEAGDGEEALSVCRAHRGPIDLLLTDAVMPRLSGGELAQEVQKMRPDTKVLFMSGFTDSTLVRHGVIQGEIDCLLKPFSAATLAQAVRDTLDLERRVGSIQGKTWERRTSERLRPRSGVKVDARMGGLGRGANIATGLLDLSLESVGVFVRSSLETGEKIDLTLSPPESEQPIKVLGEVMWARRLADGRYCAGLRFTRPLVDVEIRRLT